MFQFCLFKSKNKRSSFVLWKGVSFFIHVSEEVRLSYYPVMHSKPKEKNLIHVLFYIKMQGIFAQSKNKVAAWWSSFPKPYLDHKSKENLYTFYLFSTLTNFLIFIYIKYLLNIYFLH